MRKLIVVVAVVLLFSLVASQGAFGGNVVGYYNFAIDPGDNLVALQFYSGLNADDSPVQQYLNDGDTGWGPLPAGTTAQIWNPATNQFSPPSTFNGTSWDINYAIPAPGGVLIDNPTSTAYTVTTVGTVWQGPWFSVDGPPPATGWVPPAINTPGSYLLDWIVPQSGDDHDTLFHLAVGRDPAVGESVTVLNPLTQTYSTTFCTGYVLDGNGQPVVGSDGWLEPTWDNGNPVVDLGEAAFFVHPPLAGDANGDGRVDINDLTIVLADYNESGWTWSHGAMDGDPTGTVDINDLTIVLANYNQTFGASAAGIQAVPEPSCVVLLAIGAIGLLAFAWRRRAT
jgi:hypothetical protein